MNKFLKENWFKLGVLIVVAIIGFSLAYYYIYSLSKINSTKEDFELQAMCSKKADEFFGNYISGRTYTVHYNRKLNKCFGLTEQYLNGKDYSDFTISLIDVYEGKPYADWRTYINRETSSYNIMVGHAAGKICKDQLEFLSLIKPYMEN